MITAPKKTMAINSFKKQAITKPRDLYAKYGKRASVSAIHSASRETAGSVMPSGSAVIQSMISGQEILKHVSSDDLPE